MARSIFHLSFPVTSLSASLEFYLSVLGATVGRRTDGWADVIVFGHQLTLHELPDQVLPREQQGVRHFGAILDWSEWEALPANLPVSPQLREAGTDREHVKLLLEDPDGYVIEIKAYRNLDTISPRLGDL
ncbi:MAG TPA: VOC family protein [Thermoanaerobaculia bacterium]